MMRNNKARNQKIVVGMSGGVDSAMSLLLLKKQGWQPIGVSLRYAVWKDERNSLRENICCDAESLKIAENVCKKLDAPYHIFDVAKEFKKQVIDYFISGLKNNKTPNPCVVCNRELKFKKLFEWAKKHGIKNVATGHYARIKRNAETGKYELLRPKDKEKDQTYSLCFLPQKWLKNIIFPLQNYTKQEVYQIAEKQGFKFFLKRKQSQDFCFVAGKSLPSFLKKEIGKKPGLIINLKGKVLGGHQGLHFYTIGQRKGINLSGGPYFVAGFDVSKNILMVTKNEKEISQKEIILSPFHFISNAVPKKRTEVWAKVRYRQTLSRAVIFPPKEKKLKIIFVKPQRAVTPGQFCVFYQRENCLGGGVICGFD